MSPGETAVLWGVAAFVLAGSIGLSVSVIIGDLIKQHRRKRR